MAFHLIAIPALLSAAASIRPQVAEPVQPGAITASLEDLELKSSPIEPSWIIAGEPQARLAEHSQSADDAAITAIWDCTAGEFRWFFGWDETVMILEGDVTVTDEAGATRRLGVGDIAYFAGGTWATWNVHSYVKKIAFVRRPFPAPVVYAVKLKAMLAKLRAGAPGTLRSGL